MSTTTETQIVREAPEIEAYKLGLLKSAKALADQPVGVPVVDENGNPVLNPDGTPKIQLPTQQIAEMTGLQTKAIAEADKGIGTYQPYLTEAGYTIGDAQTAISGDPMTGAMGAAQLAGPGLTAAETGLTQAGITSLMNPYQTAIQDEINRAYDIQATQAGLQAVGQPGGPSAFGGSRAAIQQAEIGRNRASALAQAQAQNFLQAQQAAERQLDRGAAAGQARAGLGFQTGEALGTLGLRQASLGELGQQIGQREQGFIFDLGQRQQAQQQAEIEAKRQSDMAQLYEPYQRYAFLSDIYKGAPSSQQTIATSTAPNVSPAQSFLGLGIAGLSAAAGAQKAGLFG